MALASGSARGTVRVRTAAGIGALVVFAAAPAPVLAAPTDPGLEQLWREFPLDAGSGPAVTSADPAADRSDQVRTTAARRSPQPAAADTPTRSDSNDNSGVLVGLFVVMTLAVLVLLAVAAAAAWRALRTRTRGSEEKTAPRSPEPMPLELYAVPSLAAAATPGEEPPADDPTTRELYETEKALLALTTAATPLELKRPNDQPTTRELRSTRKDDFVSATATDARKLKAPPGQGSDALKLKSATPEPDGGQRADALKEKLAGQSNGDVSHALKTSAGEGTKGTGNRERRHTPSTGGAK